MKNAGKNIFSLPYDKAGLSIKDLKCLSGQIIAGS
jgi:hypothetical protein